MTLPLGSERLLGVFPHPDDEAHAAGGLLALSAQAGATVHLACATRGEAGRGRGRALEGKALGEERSLELAASCRALGVEDPFFLDLSDGRVEEQIEAGHERLLELLHRLRPQLVLSLGRDGVYGHRDHLACTSIVESSVAQAVLEGLPPPRVLLASFPWGLFTDLRDSLLRVPRLIHPEFRVGDLGILREEADLRVDISSVRDRKWAALAAHHSQLKGGDPESLLGPGVVAQLMDEEWFVQVSGEPLPGGAHSRFGAA